MDELVKINRALDWVNEILSEPNNFSEESKEYMELFRDLLNQKREKTLIERMTASECRNDKKV